MQSCARQSAFDLARRTPPCVNGGLYGEKQEGTVRSPPASHPSALPSLTYARLRARSALVAMVGRPGVALLVLFAAWAGARAEEERGHCTALGFGRKATSTGSTLLAHTDDRCVAARAAPVTPVLNPLKLAQRARDNRPAHGTRACSGPRARQRTPRVLCQRLVPTHRGRRPCPCVCSGRRGNAHDPARLHPASQAHVRVLGSKLWCDACWASHAALHKTAVRMARCADAPSNASPQRWSTRKALASQSRHVRPRRLGSRPCTGGPTCCASRS